MMDEATRQRFIPPFFSASGPVQRVLYCFTCVVSLHINQAVAARGRSSADAGGTQHAYFSMLRKCCDNVNLGY